MTPNLELARLVGSYHVHRVADNEREYLHWWDSLTYTERERVMWYQRDGVAIFDSEHFIAREACGITVSEAVAALSAAFQKLGEEISRSLNAEFGDDLGILTRLSERFRMQDSLRSVRLFGWQIIPDLACDWLSAHWPLDWMPWRILDRLRGDR